MRISYIASSGNIYDLSSRVLTRVANYHEWSFDPQTTSLMYGERVSAFKKKASIYQTTLVVRGSVTKRKSIITALHDDFERDLRNLSPGRLMFGEWFCDCFITSSSTSPDDDVNHWTENVINIYVPSGFWQREEFMSFTPTRPTPTGFLKYKYDYPYDFTPPVATSATWETDSPFPSDFVMAIKGPCNNPRVTVNGYPYVVNVVVPEDTTLVIDSKNNTVMMGDENVFDARGKEYSVFNKIPSGGLTLEWGDFDFDLTLYEERSEPKW